MQLAAASNSISTFNFWQWTGRQRSRAILGFITVMSLGLAPVSIQAGGGKISSCPFVITAPGTYSVTQDLFCSGTAITILASKVALHLGGHTISGDGTGVGISVQDVASVSVSSGIVQGFNNGVEFQHTLDCRMSNVTVRQNTVYGIWVGGGTLGLTITGNTASQNGINGINVSDSSGITITHNTASQNGQIGIAGGHVTASALTANTTSLNGFWGIWFANLDSSTVANNITGGSPYGGINLSDSTGSTVTRNTAELNGGGVGIDIDGGSSGNIVTRNSITAHYGWAIALTCNPFGCPQQNTVQDNTITGSDRGIFVFGSQNTLAGNSITLPNVGIHLVAGATGNNILDNTVLAGRDVDLEDDNFGCDSNTWSDNTFVTDLVAWTSDGGPGSGCIR